MKAIKPAVNVCLLILLTASFALSVEYALAQDSGDKEAAAAQPDLVIKAMWVTPTTPRVGEDATIYALVVNQGKGPATAHTRVRFVLRSQILYYPPSECASEYGPALYPALPAGGNEQVFAKWTPSIEGENVYIVADVDCLPQPSGQIAEADESNNREIFYVHVLAADKAERSSINSYNRTRKSKR
jgi:subtilase family serine protease